MTGIVMSKKYTSFFRCCQTPHVARQMPLITQIRLTIYTNTRNFCTIHQLVKHIIGFENGRQISKYKNSFQSLIFQNSRTIYERQLLTMLVHALPMSALNANAMSPSIYTVKQWAHNLTLCSYALENILTIKSPSWLNNLFTLFTGLYYNV